MEITWEEQHSSDFDWFCVDEQGEIGHFAHAGYKKLPPSVVASREDREFVLNFFEKEANHSSDFEIDPDLTSNGGSTEERYLRSFVAMARRGLYSFDIDSHLRPKICYFRVASPLQPVHLEDLPERVREIISRTKLPLGGLRGLSRIPYDVSLQM